MRESTSGLSAQGARRRTPGLLFTLGVPSQVSQRRAEGPGSRLRRVDRDDLVDHLRRVRVAFGVDQSVDLQQQAVDVAWVDLERLGDRFGRLGAVVVAERLGHQVMETRVRRGLLGGLPQRLHGEPVILLVQSQLGRGEIGVHEIGGLPDDRVVVQVQHLLRVSAPEQEEPAEGDLGLQRGIPSRRPGDPALDLAPHLLLAAAQPVEAADIAADQIERQAFGMTGRRLLERPERLLVLSPRHLRPDLEGEPLLVALAALECLRRLLAHSSYFPVRSSLAASSRSAAPAAPRFTSACATPHDGPRNEGETVAPACACSSNGSLERPVRPLICLLGCGQVLC